MSLSFVGNVVIASENELVKKFFIDENSDSYFKQDTWGEELKAGDTIFISYARTEPIRFKEISGEENNPIVIINYGGQVRLDGTGSGIWGALVFDDCKHIKVLGNGHGSCKYGFVLAAKTCGLAFNGLSSNCEAAFIKISHNGFFGIVAKKDYGGNPPIPVPVFEGLHIHDCFIENVSEGMYLGETKSPGMEFRHVRVYNNIVRNTKRESIQIANMVEDVEIFNNTLLNAGLEGLTRHENLLQIGDNTVANVYNNILIGAPAYGVINMGSGNNFFTNNYFANCKGVFIDDRDFTLYDSLIVFDRNYFSNIIDDSEEIIRNLNGDNYLIFKNNIFDNEDYLFYRNYFKSNTNYELVDNSHDVIFPIQFTNPLLTDYSLSENNPEKYFSMGAPGGPEYFYEDVDSVVTNEPVSEQIVLDAEMMFDEFEEGSVWSPAYLVDEQELTPENDLHPVSKNWKPYYTMKKGPYHAYIDLGVEYQITSIALHDMHSVEDLEISVGEPDNWTYLLTESCNKYKTWKTHEVDITSRYVRLSMKESPYAGVNEIVLYGYKLEESIAEKSATISGAENLTVGVAEQQYHYINSEDLYLTQNPVRDNLEIHIPTHLNEDFTIEVYSVDGKKLIEQGFERNTAAGLSINVARNCSEDGMYIMRYRNRSGKSKSLKFLKQSY